MLTNAITINISFSLLIIIVPSFRIQVSSFKIIVNVIVIVNVRVSLILSVSTPASPPVPQEASGLSARWHSPPWP